MYRLPLLPVRGRLLQRSEADLSSITLATQVQALPCLELSPLVLRRPVLVVDVSHDWILRAAMQVHVL